MSVITFYGKPGCLTNRKQKALLRQAGFELELVDLLEHPWQAEELASFFAGRPVAEWFNRAAPLVRDGHVDPEVLGAEDALSMLLAEPILIRRPLLDYRGLRSAGFDLAQIQEMLGVTLVTAEADVPENIDQCSRPQAAEGCP